ncbi:MAG: alpha/beta hydrolase [Candidatus Altiarchaeota archaeon]|nr:alpha/beta hydrolase [Candidatus Altiarchaeota archaeon]
MVLVKLKVKDQTIVGDYEKQGENAILMIHGFRGNRSEGGRFKTLAKAITASNLSVLRIDCRGSGDSEGDFFDMTVSSEVEDTLAAIKFLQKEGVKKIGLIGHSLGGEISIIAASKTKIDALGLTGPVLNSRVFVDKFNTEMKDLGNNFEYTRGNGKLGKVGKAFVEESKKIRIEDIVRTLETPILILHGTNDKTIPISDSKILADARPNVSLIILPNEYHNFTKSGIKDTAELFSKWFNYIFDKVN